ncbi:AraC family transcriptional regulator [Comamonadaceae bacterium SL12-8]|uniref:AraC family transcriptional regulator n=2 Tax=Amphibiibacter pelophylacis TaxID=1799477 RepID=A0ACC6P218_9BURK
MPPDPGLADALTQALTRALAGLNRGDWPLRSPGPAAGRLPGTDDRPRPGHFHLVPELFVQVSGWTVFGFDTGTLRLSAGELLLVPPQWRHDERVGDEAGAGVFGNAVVYAEGGRLDSHWARQVSPGKPGIAHLVSASGPAALQVEHWLQEAARVPPGPWQETQRRALIAAALAGVLAVLDQPAAPGAALDEPPWLPRVRVWLQNRLGDPTLSVRSLAQQVGCTPDHLSSVFRQHMGEPLAAHITRLRMQRAVRLLEQGEGAGKAIAWACGYASHSYFCRAFRHHHGCSPGEWAARAAAPASAAPSSALGEV